MNAYNFGKQISTSGDSFEVIDVGAIKARIKTLAGGTATASVGELFPGLYCHDLLKDLELKLPQIAADSTSTEDLKKVTFTFTTKEDEKVLVLVQYKLREANVQSVSELFPPSLYKTKKELYKGYRIIYLITNSRTDFNFTQQCDDEYRQNVGLICYIEKEDTQNPALRYFAPNLYPFYKDLESRTETNTIYEFTPPPTNQPNVGVFSNDNIIKCCTKGCKQEADNRDSKHSCDCLKNNKSCSERCQCKGCFNKVNEEENEEEDEEKEDSYTQSKKKLKTK